MEIKITPEMVTKLTPGEELRKFYRECRITQRMAAADLDGHMIIGTSALDFAAKYYSHELGGHKYCWPLPKGD